MTQPPLTDQQQEPASANGQSLDRPDLLREALSLWRELRESGHDHFRLAALETQRAGISLATMIVAGIMLAGLLNAAWLGLMAVAVAGLIEQGVGVGSALLLALAFSLALALILIGLIRRKSRYLRYPAMLRRLNHRPTAPPDLEKP